MVMGCCGALQPRRSVAGASDACKPLQFRIVRSSAERGVATELRVHAGYRHNVHGLHRVRARLAGDGVLQRRASTRRPGRTMVRIGCSGWQYKHWQGTSTPPTCARASGSSVTPQRSTPSRSTTASTGLPEAHTFRSWRERAPCRVPVCGQSEPVSHPHEEAEGSRGAAAAFLRERRAARRDAWARALPAAAALAARSRSVASISSAALPKRVRHVVEFREPSWYAQEVLDAARGARRRAVPARHDGVRERAPAGRVRSSTSASTA